MQERMAIWEVMGKNSQTTFCALRRPLGSSCELFLYNATFAESAVATATMLARRGARTRRVRRSIAS